MGIDMGMKMGSKKNKFSHLGFYNMRPLFFQRKMIIIMKDFYGKFHKIVLNFSRNSHYFWDQFIGNIMGKMRGDFSSLDL
jgi:hypothetical protein